MNPAKQPDVVIVNHNSGDLLALCLAKLNAKDPQQITVVDNASTDGSIQAAAVSNCQLIRNKVNQGFSRACNQGAETGHAPYLAFINPDCFISGEQLSVLTAALEEKPEGAIIGCRVLNEDGSFQAASYRRPPTLWRIIVHRLRLDKLPMIQGINLPEPAPSQVAYEVEAINGSCIVMRRSVFELIGGFDESYPLHFEDLDLFARARLAGKTLWYHPSVSVTHLKGQSSQSSAQVENWKRQGLVRYMQQHRPRWEYGFIRLLLRIK